MSGKSEYVPGDLVWAKLEGHPWWPGMICSSLKNNEFKKINKFGDHFHIQFFDSPPSHAWIKLKQIKPFMGKDDCQPGSLLYCVKKTFQSSLGKAEKAQFMTLKERLKLVSRLQSKSEMEKKPSNKQKATPVDGDFIIGVTRIPEQWQACFVLMNTNDIPDGLTPEESVFVKGMLPISESAKDVNDFNSSDKAEDPDMETEHKPDQEKKLEDELTESEEEMFTDSDDPGWSPYHKTKPFELPKKPKKFGLKKMKKLKEVNKSKPTSSIASKPQNCQQATKLPTSHKTASMPQVTSPKSKSEQPRTSTTTLSLPSTPATTSSQMAKPAFVVTNSAPTGPEPAIGEFLLEKSECTDGNIPFIWKYKKFGLIQKYDRIEEDGMVLYQNILSFSDWWACFAHKYQPVKTKVQYKYKSLEKVVLLQVPIIGPDEPEPEPAAPVVKETMVTPSTSALDSSLKTQEQEISSTTSEPEFKVGEFVLDIKDKRNVDNFPIWKIENNIMLKKYEAVIKGGKLFHRPMKTYRGYEDISKYYLPLKVKDVGGDCVEVTVNTRPRLNVDTSLEDEYERNPLLRHFYVYMQVLLSQALEPGFLDEVKKSNDPIYIFPIGEIDKIVKQKTTNIERKLRWSEKIKAALQKCPYLREVQKPNEKRKCEALTESTENVQAVVFLFGSNYDPETLQPIGNATPPCQEFKIGKTAIKHISNFHQLCHFKYNLYDKCLAKIKIEKETLGGDVEIEKIMDNCLGNKAWVLQNFEDFTKLVELT